MRPWALETFMRLMDDPACQAAFLAKRRDYEEELQNVKSQKAPSKTAVEKVSLAKTKVVKHYLLEMQKAALDEFSSGKSKGKSNDEGYRLVCDVLLTEELLAREGIDDGWDRIRWQRREVFAGEALARTNVEGPKQHHALMVGLRFLADAVPDMDPLVLGDDLTDQFDIRLHKVIKQYKAEIDG